MTTSNPIDWNAEETIDPEKEYRALLRSIRYQKGFGLLFIQCAPAEGTRLIARVREDLPQKNIEVLTLKESINNLYYVVDDLPNKDQIDVLFIQGIEYSLYEYEKTQLWDEPGEQYAYSQKGIPSLLGSLNLGRERFYENFKFHFVFLVPLFVIKYLARRAPDFFDWRSGVLEFRADSQTVANASRQLYGDYNEYITWTQAERDRQTLKIQAWLEEPHQTLDHKADLLFEQGNLFAASGDYKSAIASYDKAFQIKPDNHNAWYNRGLSLHHLGRYEEAIASYDKALQIKPDDHKAWNNRGLSLDDLGRYEEAITNYDKALQIKPGKHEAWNNRGISLHNLGRYEEAITNYDKALQIKPDRYEAWNNRGGSLHDLGRYEEAITNYDKALQIKPDDHEAWNSRGILLGNLGHYEEAIASYGKALQIKPNFASAFYNKACCYGLQKLTQLAVASLKQAIALNPEYRQMAATDSDFDSIRNDDRLQALMNEAEP